MDAPYEDEYCCEVIVNGKWVDTNPDTAARATCALLKGAKWVETNISLSIAPGELISSSETEISHGRVSWQDCSYGRCSFRVS